MAHAPGGPTHVLLSDEVAEHVPGCNMAFRRAALEAVGGFDPQFRVAGDDVDICWRLQERGWTIGFSPAAVVLHRRRRSVRGYLKQQAEYGKAEALLERKWPEKLQPQRPSRLGGPHVRRLAPARRRRRPRSATAPGAPTSSSRSTTARRARSGRFRSMPEWYLLIAWLAVLAIVGVFEHPLVPWTAGAPVRIEPAPRSCATALSCLTLSAAQRASTRRAPRPSLSAFRRSRWSCSSLQPAARLAGRLRCGLTPWRRRGDLVVGWPWPRRRSIWSEHWRPPSDRLARARARSARPVHGVVRGGEFDRWDIHVRVRSARPPRACALRSRSTGRGRQLVRARVRPRWSRLVPVAGAVLGVGLAGVVETGSYLALAAATALSSSLVPRGPEAGAGVVLVLRAIEGRARTEDEELTLYEELLAPRAQPPRRCSRRPNARGAASAERSGWSQLAVRPAGLPLPAAAQA